MIFDGSAELITDTLLLAYAITIDSPHGMDTIDHWDLPSRRKGEGNAVYNKRCVE
jgi:hypothetical protein